MPSTPHPFKTRAPFHSRVVGLDYHAFGTDPVNPPYPTTFGCLLVMPQIEFNADGPFGGPFTPDSQEYALTNSGGSTMNWSLVLSETWLTCDTLSGVLLPNETITITVEIDADTLPVAPSPYTADLTFTNTTNGCGDTVLVANLSVT